MVLNYSPHADYHLYAAGLCCNLLKWHNQAMNHIISSVSDENLIFPEYYYKETKEMFLSLKIRVRWED